MVWGPATVRFPRLEMGVQSSLLKHQVRKCTMKTFWFRRNGWFPTCTTTQEIVMSGNTIMKGADGVGR